VGKEQANLVRCGAALWHQFLTGDMRWHVHAAKASSLGEDEATMTDGKKPRSAITSMESCNWNVSAACSDMKLCEFTPVLLGH